MARYHVRRTDREIVGRSEIDSVLLRGRFATLAMCHDGEPYAVTLSYGYDAGARALYFHLAPVGRKVEAISRDPRVCGTVVIDGGYEPGACKHHYESVVFEGEMALVKHLDERRHGMRVLLSHLEDDPDTVWERNKLSGDTVYDRMAVARLDIREITGKAGT
jgi:uncharacterized protein